MAPNIKFPVVLQDSEYDPNDLVLPTKSATRRQRTRQLSVGTSANAPRQEETFFLHQIDGSDEELALPPPPPPPLVANNTNNDDIPLLENEEEHEAHAEVHKYIRRMSDLLSDPMERLVDEKRLVSAIRETGETAFGIAAIEVYELHDDSGLLVRSKGSGWWSNPDAVSDDIELAAIIAEQASEDITVVPGVDVAGTLWSTSLSGSLDHNKFWTAKGLGSTSNLASSASTISLQRHHQLTNALLWRELKVLMDDPDVANGQLLPLFQKAGFELAAGVPFASHGHRGMVVFYAHAGVDRLALSTVTNECFLRRSTEYIGSTLSVSYARRAAVAANISKLRPVAPMPSAGEKSEEDDDEDPESAIENKVAEVSDPCHVWLLCRAKSWYRKCWGGGMQIPPPLSTQQSAWTIVGVFFGLLALSSLNELFQHLSQEEYFLLIGPFGALMTLQYGLTAAPASQPRNVVLGQIVAGAVSMSFTYIPDDIIAPWLRQAIAPAFAIGAMVKLGIPHPPAGAHSVIYAAGNHSWVFYALVVLCSAVSVIPATIINNISEKRQYPIYWGYLPNFLYRKVKAVFD